MNDDRRSRLKAALRDNLKRRKAQARGRDEAAETGRPASGDADQAEPNSLPEGKPPPKPERRDA